MLEFLKSNRNPLQEKMRFTVCILAWRVSKVGSDNFDLRSRELKLGESSHLASGK